MKAELLQAVVAARAARRPVAIVTQLDSGAQSLIEREGAGPELAEAFRFDRSGVMQTPAGPAFVAIHNPPLRLVIIGAVLISQHVVPLARGLGYDITVIDPRSAFATAQRFPGVTLCTEWPDEVLPGLGLDARTAFMALTHDPKIDDPALAICLRSDAFYIGALGSKKTQAARQTRLRAIGFDDTSLARIHGPIGLAIGAQGASEIAVSIMAEVTKALRIGTSHP